MLNAERGKIDSVIVVMHESFMWGGGDRGVAAGGFVSPAGICAVKEWGGGAWVGESVPGFELHLAIEHVRDLLISGGGHAMAGGVKLVMGMSRRSRTIGGVWAGAVDGRTACSADGIGWGAGVGDCTLEAIGAMERLAPFGRGIRGRSFCWSGCG